MRDFLLHASVGVQTSWLLCAAAAQPPEHTETAQAEQPATHGQPWRTSVNPPNWQQISWPVNSEGNNSSMASDSPAGLGCPSPGSEQGGSLSWQGRWCAKWEGAGRSRNFPTNCAPRSRIRRKALQRCGEAIFRIFSRRKQNRSY